MTHADPFAGIDPEEFEPESLPSLKTKKVGDFWTGTVTKVSETFEGRAFEEGKPGDTMYAVTVLTEVVHLTEVPDDGDEPYPYTPPEPGEEATLYVKVGGHIDKIIRDAAKKAGTNGLSEGDYLAVKLLEKVKGKYPQPFKKHGAIVKPGKKAETDPFTDEAPF